MDAWMNQHLWISLNFWVYPSWIHLGLTNYAAVFTFKYSRQKKPSEYLRIFIIFIRTQPRFPRVSEHVCSRSPWYLIHNWGKLRLLDESSPVFVQNQGDTKSYWYWLIIIFPTCRFGDFGYLPFSDKPWINHTVIGPMHFLTANVRPHRLITSFQHPLLRSSSSHFQQNSVGVLWKWGTLKKHPKGLLGVSNFAPNFKKHFPNRKSLPLEGRCWWRNSRWWCLRPSRGTAFFWHFMTHFSPQGM